MIHNEDEDDFRIDLADFAKRHKIVQVEVPTKSVWVWCVRRAGVEGRRGVSCRQLSDDELLALLHPFTNTQA